MMGGVDGGGFLSRVTPGASSFRQKMPSQNQEVRRPYNEEYEVRTMAKLAASTDALRQEQIGYLPEGRNGTPNTPIARTTCAQYTLNRGAKDIRHLGAKQQEKGPREGSTEVA
jgi:hypothetical protein